MVASRPRDEVVQVLVLVGGDPVADTDLPVPSPGARVIAADSGLALAKRLGVTADVVVGDLDSVDPRQLEAAREAGSRVERHPRVKDRTDLAIALDAALDLAPAHVQVLGGHAGRLDHLLANALLLASPRYAALRPVARVGPATITVVHDDAEVRGRPGALVSLLPAHGAAEDVRTHGLRFPLTGETLPPGSSRGVSNALLGHDARIEVGAGTLLAIQPGDPDHSPTRDPNRSPRQETT